MTAVAGTSERTMAGGADGGPMLALTDVHTYYGNIHALQGVTIEVAQGEIVTLLGANGAGKTTTLKTISGLLTPRQGSVIFEGADIARMQAHQLVKLGIGHARVLDRISDGLDVAFQQASSTTTDRPRLELDSQMGIGALEVVRGDDPIPSQQRTWRDSDVDLGVACP